MCFSSRLELLKIVASFFLNNSNLLTIECHYALFCFVLEKIQALKATKVFIWESKSFKCFQPFFQNKCFRCNFFSVYTLIALCWKTDKLYRANKLIKKVVLKFKNSKESSFWSRVCLLSTQNPVKQSKMRKKIFLNFECWKNCSLRMQHLPSCGK